MHRNPNTRSTAPLNIHKEAESLRSMPNIHGRIAAELSHARGVPTNTETNQPRTGRLDGSTFRSSLIFCNVRV